MAAIAKKCPCLRPKIEDDIKVLDYKHSSLHDVPSEVFNKERTLEELYVDANQIRDLPRELFFCHGLRKLSISDNELTSIPPAISSLANLEELDFSKNGIIDVPDSIKGCKYLRSIDASVNPLGKLPEGFTYLTNLTHLYLNDTFLDYLPGSCGRMVKLKILELRENHIKSLPRSFSRLTSLERLDIGNNEFTELTDVISGLSSLLELWCDNNQIMTIARSIGRLKHLMFLDVSSNQLQELPKEIDGCVSLADLHLTSNNLVELPDTIGHLSNLITLKADDNQLAYLPKTLGGLSSLSELIVSANDLEDLPAGIGLLRNLRTFYADENLLHFIPAEIGSCSGITVLSLRNNKLTYIPDELGRIPRLRVLNLSDNRLLHLPFSIVKLKELQALWLTENQTRPLIPLQSDYEAGTGRKILTCYLLPQGQPDSHNERQSAGDNESFHASMWDEERLQRQQIHFAFADGSDEEGTLVRCPTPYPKEMRQKVRHAHNLTTRQIKNITDGSRSGEDVAHGAAANDHSSRLAGVADEADHQEYGYSKAPDQYDLRFQEARGITKPTSPRPQESHRLYRNDKEKLLKDKARMQHRLSVPDFDSGLNGFLKDAQNKNKKVKLGESRLSDHSGSVPDLTSSDVKEVTSAPRHFEASALTSSSSHHDDLYYKQIVHRHKGRRSRRMREYDSDTDFRSDYELIQLRQDVRDDSSRGVNLEILSVQSQPLPYHYHHQNNGRWREGTSCISNLEGYPGGGSFPTANAAAAAFQRKYQQAQRPAQNSSYTAAQSRASTPDSSRNFRPNSPLKSEFYKLDNRPSSEVKSRYCRASDFKENTKTRSDHPLNSTKTNNLNVLGDGNNTMSNDEFLKHIPNSEYYQPFHTKGNNVAIKASNHYSSNQISSETVFQTHLTSRSPAQKPSDLEPLQQKQVESSRNSSSQERLPGLPDGSKCDSLSGSNLSLQHSSHSATPSPPTFQKDIFVDQSTPVQSQAPLSLAEESASLNYATVKDYNGSKLCTVLEEISVSQKHLNSDHSALPGQSPTIPPPYNPAPPYRRPSDNASIGPRTKRLSSDSSSSHVDSPRSVSNMLGTIGEASSLISSPAIQNLIGNRSQSSPCGFHGSSPYRDLTATPREKLSFTNYADVDHRRQDYNYGSGSYKLYRDNHSSRSGSSSSQICSASQIRSIYPLEVRARIHSQSESSDSQSDGHNHSSPHDSPQSGSAYGSPQTSSRQERPCSRSSGNYEEFSAIPNQEQSSQVSSSTDSGYGHGHHVYEPIGNHLITKCEKHSSPGGQGSDKLEVTPAASSQRQTPVKGSGNICSRDVTTPNSATHEHKEQFRITIKKKPGLGFSIAGGIGSHGNPFREKDIGIFVTKVIADGPASKFLKPGDKILEVNKVDFQVIEHNQAVAVLKKNNIVTLLIERVQKVNVV